MQGKKYIDMFDEEIKLTKKYIDLFKMFLDYKDKNHTAIFKTQMMNVLLFVDSYEMLLDET